MTDTERNLLKLFNEFHKTGKAVDRAKIYNDTPAILKLEVDKKNLKIDYASRPKRAYKFKGDLASRAIRNIYIGEDLDYFFNEYIKRNSL